MLSIFSLFQKACLMELKIIFQEWTSDSIRSKPTKRLDSYFTISIFEFDFPGLNLLYPHKNFHPLLFPSRLSERV